MIRHCIRAIAIGLIIFPEPVTTAVGVALLSATLAFPRHKRLDSFENIEELICRSFKIPEPRRFGRYLEEEKKVVFHAIKRNPNPKRTTAHSGLINSKRVEQKTAKRLQPCSTKNSDILRKTNTIAGNNLTSNYSANKWFDNRRVNEKVLHHTLKTSLPQYQPKKTAKSFSSSISPA